MAVSLTTGLNKVASIIIRVNQRLLDLLKWLKLCAVNLQVTGPEMIPNFRVTFQHQKKKNNGFEDTHYNVDIIKTGNVAVITTGYVAIIKAGLSHGFLGLQPRGLKLLGAPRRNMSCYICTI